MLGSLEESFDALLAFGGEGGAWAFGRGERGLDLLAGGLNVFVAGLDVFEELGHGAGGAAPSGGGSFGGHAGRVPEGGAEVEGASGS